MKKTYSYVDMYTDILDALSSGSKRRGDIINFVAARAKVPTVCSGTDACADASVIRAKCGALINEMHEKRLIATDKTGAYYALIDKPMALRRQRCEAQILKNLEGGALSKDKLKSALIAYFGTEKTETKRDDNILASLINDTLGKLTADGIIRFDGSKYHINPKKRVEANDLAKIASLKADFLSVLHSRGGEFFEHYFMNLLGKYLKKIGKTVLECKVTGGAADGGIDGTAITKDPLGFKERIMVQTKNRTETVTEIDVRGFYGAVHAKQGSRGIFATTSSFHPVAREFLDSLDDCVGVDGERIFEMACATGYGIIRRSGTLYLDTKII